MTSPTPPAVPPDIRRGSGNLTEERLISQPLDLSPIPDHDLVVFKRLGTGLEFRQIVPPWEIFKPRLFESPSAFVAFAVSRDENLRHVFNQRFRSDDQVHFFDLRVTLAYKVNNPLRLVEKRGTDPLQRLMDEVEELLRIALRRLDWSVIALDNDAFEERVLHREAFDGSGQTNLVRLQKFARNIGLELRAIHLTRSLPEDEVRVAQTVKAVAEDIQIERARHDLNLENQEREHEIRNRDNAQGIRNTFAVAEAGIVERIGKSVQTITDVKRILPELQMLQKQARGLGAGQAYPALPEAASGPQSLPARGGLETLLQQIPVLLSGLACEEEPRRRLGAALLHLVAECYLGGPASPDELKWLEEIRTLLGPLFKQLDAGHAEVLRRFQDTEALRRELA